MKTTAAVLVELGKPLEFWELDVPELKPGQVLVEIAYSGVCHTQLLEVRGHRGPDPFLPHCLGHEGSGIIRAIGSDVRKVKPGDRVLLSWIKGQGGDVPGTTYRHGEQTVNSGAITTFGRHTVISENRVNRLPDDVPLEVAAMLGCAVSTGFGVVLNNLKAEQGKSLAVFGCGGIGLCAIMAASSIGLDPIVAVDIAEDKLSVAKQLGATHIINGGKVDAVQELTAVKKGGLDYAVEATGQPTVMRQALQSVRPQGGIAVVLGNAKRGQELSIDPRELNAGKQLRGSWGGETIPDRDLPRFLEILGSKTRQIELLTSSRYPLSQLNAALDDLESGRALRPLIDMGLTDPNQ